MGYFGTTARQAMRLPPLARGGELVLTRAVAADPRVAILFQARGLEGEVLPTDLPDHPHVLRLAASVRLGAGGTVAGR